MKLITILFATLMGANAMAASAIPACWSDETANVADGNFVANFDTSLMTKEELVKALDLAKDRYLNTPSYPMIFGENMYIVIEGYDSATRKMPRDEFEAKVAAALEPLSKIPGVSFTCNHLVSIDPPQINLDNLRRHLESGN